MLQILLISYNVLQENNSFIPFRGANLQTCEERHCGEKQFFKPFQF